MPSTQRIIVGVEWSGIGDAFANHRDRDLLDNTRPNLRMASPSFNSHNSKKRTGTSSQFIGVEFQNTCRCRAKCVKYIGTYDTEGLAARARDFKALSIYGIEANLNFPGDCSDVTDPALALSALAKISCRTKPTRDLPKYIVLHHSRFVVKIDGKDFGHFMTLPAAVTRLAQVLAERAAAPGRL